MKGSPVFCLINDEIHSADSASVLLHADDGH